MRLTCENTDVARSQKTLTSIYYLGASLLQKDRIDQDTIQRFEIATGEGKQTVGIACVICLIALFFLSFGFVIQPASLPSEEELYAGTDATAEIQMISVTPENAYLSHNTDGTYSLYIDGEFFMTVAKEEAKYEPYILLPIKTPKS
jgi:hypothetical protein